ncbi:hypothetical protein ACTWP6_18985 [Mycobacterium sp. 4D054]|uniref:hypothetical protein n=1 Tax=Mycobacterium sp. 4D054 TaxID=3457440 RepID=UPI003FD3A1D4
MSEYPQKPRPARLLIPRTRTGGDVMPSEADCSDCPADHAGTVNGQAVVWHLIGCTEDDCEYEAQGVV